MKNSILRNILFLKTREYLENNELKELIHYENSIINLEFGIMVMSKEDSFFCNRKRFNISVLSENRPNRNLEVAQVICEFENLK